MLAIIYREMRRIRGVNVAVLQVEHPVTEQIHSDLDLVELMIKQAVAHSSNDGGLRGDSSEMQQGTYDDLYQSACRGGLGYAIEGRIYGENPYEGFAPSAGLLQYVSFGEPRSWLRVDTWVSFYLTSQHVSCNDVFLG